MIDWDKFRRNDKSINLVRAFEEEHKEEGLPNKEAAILFLKVIESYQIIKSQQVAALALAEAYLISVKV